MRDARVAEVSVRAVEPPDAEAWIELRSALWPGFRDDHEREVAAFVAAPPPREACFVAVDAGRGLLGFAEIRLREYAEDCTTSPVGYLEGIYVAPDARGLGIGRALVAAGEAWARRRGCSEMASDREIDNDASGAFHEALGYEETVRLVAYRKPLGPGGSPHE